MEPLPLEPEDDLLTRRERLRLQRQIDHAAPARINLRISAVIVVLVGLLSWILISWLTRSTDTTETLTEVVPLEAASLSPQPENLEDQAPDVLIVHVAGAVNDPQVVELEPGDRVIDAVEAAGGITEEAAPQGINLAAAAEDGTLIFVPTADELETGELPSAAVDAPGASHLAGTPEQAAINLNTADAAELQQLPGVGPAIADRIIAYREANGSFGALEELAAVSGIGPAILENIADDVTW